MNRQRKQFTWSNEFLSSPVGTFIMSLPGLSVLLLRRHLNPYNTICTLVSHQIRTSSAEKILKGFRSILQHIGGMHTWNTIALISHGPHRHLYSKRLADISVRKFVAGCICMRHNCNVTDLHKVSQLEDTVISGTQGTSSIPDQNRIFQYFINLYQVFPLFIKQYIQHWPILRFGEVNPRCFRIFAACICIAQCKPINENI